jgi:transcription antitermination factor NusA-like protein
MRLNLAQIEMIRDTTFGVFGERARVASRVSRAMNGRKVDVVLKAPNLMIQPVHDLATQTGVVL